MLKPKPQFVINKIIRSIVCACTEDINYLNDTAYRWLHIKSGFIAHYNRHGFIGHYGEPYELKQAILNQKGWNCKCGRTPDDPDYKYYKQQADTYQRIVDILSGHGKIPSRRECSIMHNADQVEV